MRDVFSLIWLALIGLFRSRASLQVEILTLRHQLNVLRRKSPQPLTFPCACRKSNSDILVVQPAENWAAKNLPGPFDGTRERRILLQGEMCAGAIIIFHVRQQQ